MPKRKKKPAGKVFIYSLKNGLGCPPGYCLANAHFLARYKNRMWEIVLEFGGAHKHLHHAEGGPDHAVCGPGSIIFGESNPLVTLESLIESMRKDGSPLEQWLCKLRPTGRDIVAKSVNMVIGENDINWDVAEGAVEYLLAVFVGLPDRLNFVWIDRNQASEDAFHKERLEERLKLLRSGALSPTVRISPEEVAKVAEQNEVTIEEAKEHFAKKGFEEQEDGSLVRNPSRINHGLAEVFEARLTAVAKQLGYTGAMFLSPTSWPRVPFVAAGEFMSFGNNERRAWFGYLKQARMLVIMPLDQQVQTEMYEIPGDPDFLPVMNPVVSEAEQKPLR